MQVVTLLLMSAFLVGQMQFFLSQKSRTQNLEYAKCRVRGFLKKPTNFKMLNIQLYPIQIEKILIKSFLVASPCEYCSFYSTSFIWQF